MANDFLSRVQELFDQVEGLSNTIHYPNYGRKTRINKTQFSQLKTDIMDGIDYLPELISKKEFFK